MSSPIIGGGLTTAPPQATNSWNLISLLNQAYRLSGALKNPGMGISPSESQEALDCLNWMIDGMKIENLMIVLYLRTYQTVQTNKQTYSVGPGQDFDIERPEKIHSAGYILQGQTTSEAELPMEVLLNYTQYAGFVAKNVGSSIPLALYYQATLPYGTVTLWPVPNTTSQIVLYTQATLEQFLTINDPIVVPQGYMEMLVYNLAVRIHQRYPDRPWDASVFEMATFYKERVKNQQLTPIFINSDPAVCEQRGENYSSIPKSWVPWGP
jgi:hypothetical protein